MKNKQRKCGKCSTTTSKNSLVKMMTDLKRAELATWSKEAKSQIERELLREMFKDNPNIKEFTTDDPDKIGTGAIKYDGGKPCAFRGCVEYFPRAIYEVARVSTFGASKYAWKGWEGVEDGIARYSDAMVRHLLKEGSGELVDPDSKLLHAAHTAWGALARLELILREGEREHERFVRGE